MSSNEAKTSQNGVLSYGKKISGDFVKWLKSCLAKRNLAFCHMALKQKSIYQESPTVHMSIFDVL